MTSHCLGLDWDGTLCLLVTSALAVQASISILSQNLSTTLLKFYYQRISYFVGVTCLLTANKMNRKH